jgi:hypothetical protein
VAEVVTFGLPLHNIHNYYQHSTLNFFCIRTAPHLQREQAVGVAEVVDVARLGDLHEVLASAALAVAGSAPAGHVALGHQVLHHLFKTNNIQQVAQHEVPFDVCVM